MEYFPPALENLVEHFAKLPGIGRKTAQRLAFYVLSLPQEEADAFAQSITQAKTAIHCCPVCQNLTEGEGPCAICASQKRDRSTVCVVADPKDVVAMERSRDMVIGKGAFPSLWLANWLKEQGYDRVELAGLVSYLCVLSNAIMVKAALPEAEIVVDASCTAGPDPDLHAKGLDVMEALQITVLNR